MWKLIQSWWPLVLKTTAEQVIMSEIGRIKEDYEGRLRKEKSRGDREQELREQELREKTQAEKRKTVNEVLGQLGNPFKEMPEGGEITEGELIDIAGVVLLNKNGEASYVVKFPEPKHMYKHDQIRITLGEGLVPNVIEKDDILWYGRLIRGEISH